MKLSRISQPRLLYTEETSRENIQKITKVIQKISTYLKTPVEIPSNYIETYNSLHEENPTDESKVSAVITKYFNSLFDLNAIYRGLIPSDSEYYKDVKPDPNLITFLAPDNTQEVYNAANQSLRLYYSQTMGLKFRQNATTEDIFKLLNMLFEDGRPVTDYRFYLALSRKIELMKMIYYYVMEEYVDQNIRNINFSHYYKKYYENKSIKEFPKILYDLLDQEPGKINEIVRYCPQKLGVKLKEQLKNKSNPKFLDYFSKIHAMLKLKDGVDTGGHYETFVMALNKYH